MADHDVDIEIVPHGRADEALMADLGELHSDLVESDINADASTVALPGVKTDLTLAIAIAGLALSGVSTLVSVLAFWQSRKAKYSVSIPTEEATYEISNLGKEAVLEVAEKIRRHRPKVPLVVRISRV